ncbi:MAG: 2,3-bisphosphoglycerate-independent phosphoglycerate mutase [Oscillospiraceae bacterium]|nr:2,3-bisphosphoglycerate-independent phosphoglycerate mutase [Oscillospiraceae bacterium]
MKTPVTLIIMDGFGLSDSGRGNAVRAAATPNFDALWSSCPHSTLEASGPYVGLPEGTMGNSEVGHTNIGAGRVVYQSLLRISNSIADGSFFENPVLTAAASGCRGRAHIFVLLSDVGVHSDIAHVWALLKLLKDRGVKTAWIHCFTDGRDSSPTSGKDYMRLCVDKCREIGLGAVATVEGRFYAMDRDKRWNRVEKAYNNIVLGEGVFEPDPVKAVENSYAADVTDEFIEPVICDRDGTVQPGDTVFFMNFRPDRARELTRAFVTPDFDGFERKKGFFPVDFVCLTQYAEDIPNVSVAFPPEFPENTLGEYLSGMGMTQLRIAETEKYAHVTFFFNGVREAVFEGEDRVLIPSPKEYETYDLIPEMRANEVCAEVCSRIRSGKYDLVVVNYANCDMVGHTGVWEAVIKAVETVDKCVGMTVAAAEEMGGIAIITADHGNAERMLSDDNSPHTAHTTNKVPFIIRGADVSLRDGRLCDIAPTILYLMGLEKPTEMSGDSLII